MRHFRVIFVSILVVALLGTSTYCSGLRMAGMAQGLGDSCCTACHRTNHPPQTCDRCDMGPLGGLLATIHRATHAPTPDLVAELPALPRSVDTPISSVAAIALSSHPPPPTSLVALHCQMTT